MEDILKFFYVYPIAKIREQFPKLKKPESNFGSYAETGIISGWAPPMAEKANQIAPIFKEDTAKGIVILSDGGWEYDIRLGEILIVDTKKTADCYFLEKRDGVYRISDHRTVYTVGGILNRPSPPKPKKMNRLARMLAGRKEKTHDNMATGHGT